MPSAIDKSDVQALVRGGFATLTEARYYLLDVIDVDAARQWLSSAPVNDATPKMHVDAETYTVTADGEELRCEPASVLPLAQRYFLF